MRTAAPVIIQSKAIRHLPRSEEQSIGFWKISVGDEAIVVRIEELERDKVDRWEAVERDKLDVLQEALGG